MVLLSAPLLITFKPKPDLYRLRTVKKAGSYSAKTNYQRKNHHEVDVCRVIPRGFTRLGDI